MDVNSYELLHIIHNTNAMAHTETRYYFLPGRTDENQSGWRLFVAS